MKLLDSIFRISLFNNVGLKITAVALGDINMAGYYPDHEL